MTDDDPMPALVEIAPGRWRVLRRTVAPARADLPLPYVISDEMPPTEQVDGKFYTSKRAFRAVGRALGLTEVGNEFRSCTTVPGTKPRQRPVERRETKVARRRMLERALAEYKLGRRPRRTQHRA
jgi:hypothetical protein